MSESRDPTPVDSSASRGGPPSIELHLGLIDPKCEAVLSVAPDGSIVSAYPIDSALFERRDEGAGRLADRVPREWLAVLEDRLRVARATFESCTVELDRPLGSLGPARTFRIRIAPGDECAYLLLRDLSFDPRRAFAADTTDDASFWALFEVAPIPMAVGSVDPQSSISPTRFNRRFTETFGYTTDDIPTVQHWWPLAYPDEAYRDRLRSEWTRRLDSVGGDVSQLEPMFVRVRCKDGSEREIELSTATIAGRHVATFVDLTERNRARRELSERVVELECALAEVKVLRGLIPLCAWCKKIRDDQGFWCRVEEFLASHTDSKVTHGICPECQEREFGIVPT